MGKHVVHGLQLTAEIVGNLLRMQPDGHRHQIGMRLPHRFLQVDAGAILVGHHDMAHAGVLGAHEHLLAVVVKCVAIDMTVAINHSNSVCLLIGVVMLLFF